MEIIGRNIPHLQSAISSGFDTVTAGIAESVKIAGVSALDSTFELFSASKMGIASDANLLPAVANVAEYTDPITALSRQSTSSSEAASSALPLLQTMQDPKFRPEAELATFTEEKVNEAFKNLAKEIIVKADSESAEGRSLLRNDPLLTPEALAAAMFEFEEKKAQEIEAKFEQLDPTLLWKRLKKSFGQLDELPYDSASLVVPPRGIVNQLPYVSASSTELNGTGSSSQLDAEAFAAADIGMPSSNTLEARGIIIVGGKTDGTYFKTIDDTINELQSEPQPETVEILQNQVTAVQDMTSTAMKSVRVYQEYSGSLMANIRG